MPRAASVAPPRWSWRAPAPTWCCPRGSASSLEDAAGECRALGAEVLTVVADVVDEADVERVRSAATDAVRRRRRLGAHGRRRGLRALRGRAVRDLPAGPRHQRPRLGARRPGGTAPVPRAGPRHAGAHRLAARRDRHAVHEQLRDVEVGGAWPRAGARRRGPRPARRARLHRVAGWRRHARLPAGRELRRASSAGLRRRSTHPRRSRAPSCARCATTGHDGPSGRPTS